MVKPAKIWLLLFLGLLSAGLLAPTVWAEKETLKLEAGTYTGRVYNGVPHGRGSMILHDGSRFVGMYRNGERHGLGKVTYADGSQYVGE